MRGFYAECFVTGASSAFPFLVLFVTTGDGRWKNTPEITNHVRGHAGSVSRNICSISRVHMRAKCPIIRRSGSELRLEVRIQHSAANYGSIRAFLAL